MRGLMVSTVETGSSGPGIRALLETFCSVSEILYFRSPSLRQGV